MLIPGNYKKAVRFVHTDLTRFTETQETGYRQAECICIDRVSSEVEMTGIQCFTWYIIVIRANNVGMMSLVRQKFATVGF